MTQTISLDSLGITQEELTTRVVTRIADTILNERYEDEYGDTSAQKTHFMQTMERQVIAKIDTAIQDIAAKHVLPNVADYIEKLTLQKTNEWGEKTGKPCTFVEYLVQRAEHYMNEKVNYEGKPKGTDSYNWTGTQTRITHMVDKHLHYSIETAMKNALAIATSSIGTSIAETCKTKLGEIASAMRVEVKTK